MTLHSEPTCINAFNIHPVEARVLELGQCVTFVEDTTNSFAVFDSCSFVDGIANCSVGTVPCDHWTKQSPTSCPGDACTYDHELGICHDKNAKPVCSLYSAPNCGGASSSCYFEPLINMCIPRDACSCSSTAISGETSVPVQGCTVGTSETDFPGQAGCYIAGGAEWADACGCVTNSSRYPGAAFRPCLQVDCTTIIPVQPTGAYQPTANILAPPQSASEFLIPYRLISDIHPVGCRPIGYWISSQFAATNGFSIMDMSETVKTKRGDIYDAIWSQYQPSIAVFQRGGGMRRIQHNTSEANAAMGGSALVTMFRETVNLNGFESITTQTPWTKFDVTGSPIGSIDLKFTCSAQDVCLGVTPRLEGTPVEYIPTAILRMITQLQLIPSIFIENLKPTIQAFPDMPYGNVTVAADLWFPVGERFQIAAGARRVNLTCYNCAPPASRCQTINLVATGTGSTISFTLVGLYPHSMTMCHVIETTSTCLPRASAPLIFHVVGLPPVHPPHSLVLAPSAQLGCLNVSLFNMTAQVWRGEPLGVRVRAYSTTNDTLLVEGAAYSPRVTVNSSTNVANLVFYFSDLVCQLPTDSSLRITAALESMGGVGPFGSVGTYFLPSTAPTVAPKLSFFAGEAGIDVEWPGVDDPSVVAIEIWINSTDSRIAVLERKVPLSNPLADHAVNFVLQDLDPGYTAFARFINVHGTGPWSDGTQLSFARISPSPEPTTTIDTNAATGEDRATALRISSLVVVVVAVCVVIVLLFLFARRYSTRKGESNVPAVDLDCFKDWEVSRGRIAIDTTTVCELGQIKLHRCFLAAASDQETRVAVADYELDDPSVSQDVFSCFVLAQPADESVKLAMVKDAQMLVKLSHESLIGLVGTSFNLESWIVIVEPVRSSLSTFLRSNRPTPDCPSSVTECQLLEYALDVVDALSFLEEKGVIHNNIQADSVYIALHGSAVLGGFGDARLVEAANTPESMARDVESLPIRWMAPEVITDNQPSVKSDIYSFGVLLWELFTYGRRPWPGYAHAEIAQIVTKQSALLLQPDDCPHQVYRVMKQCWKATPSIRPTPKTLDDVLTNVLENLYGEPLGKDDKDLVKPLQGSLNASSMA
ncbi:uncharacterized protein MONBRDRAFT_29807 [Monosiga brevicollis MX1]|uniref:Uncharacterized protein n=1 Tax=Monosiga brevicollis TaxID=81824 RepID=A9VC65_MONBE|nr:uncharacterized protein MONBRDRAFT_29807 [Monosiga brevicollis MX1]EDQ84845.1 predicted protein [Monosiga brevicollis MX1]|eukprot:XP_001750346.1 hypothetical protein [Monosiga brevicollis MX1]